MSRAEQTSADGEEASACSGKYALRNLLGWAESWRDAGVLRDCGIGIAGLRDCGIEYCGEHAYASSYVEDFASAPGFYVA